MKSIPMRDILHTILIVLIISLVNGLFSRLEAAEPEQMVADRANQILDMIGPHGIFAIMGSIMIVRLIRVLWYLDKRQAFIATFIVSAIIGAASTYFALDNASIKQIFGGAFMTMLGSPLAFAIATWLLAFSYQHLKWDLIRRLYFFLSPRPIKIKSNGQIQKVDPDESLTEFFDKARIDKDDITRRRQ